MRSPQDPILPYYRAEHRIELEIMQQLELFKCTRHRVRPTFPIEEGPVKRQLIIVGNLNFLLKISPLCGWFIQVYFTFNDQFSVMLVVYRVLL